MQKYLQATKSQHSLLEREILLVSPPESVSISSVAIVAPSEHKTTTPIALEVSDVTFVVPQTEDMLLGDCTLS
jgi:hypothetical protein